MMGEHGNELTTKKGNKMTVNELKAMLDKMDGHDTVWLYDRYGGSGCFSDEGRSFFEIKSAETSSVKAFSDSEKSELDITEEKICALNGDKTTRNEKGELHSYNDEPAVISADGDKWWYRNDKIHRDGDKPAIVMADGSEEWYKDGKRHREGDEPAAVYAYGDKYWWKNDKRHRDGDKPAIVEANGDKEWWKNGKFVRSEN